jgi:signal peptidase II
MAMVASSERVGRRTAVLTRAGVTAAIVVGLDQLTKRTVADSIRPGQVKHVLPGIHLVHVTNTGVAFSILSGGGALVLVITFVALALLLGYLVLRPQRRLLWLPTGLLIGGALGNLIDRLIHGAVTDFIKLPDWPAFNVADIAITAGVIALALVLELGARRGHG